LLFKVTIYNAVNVFRFLFNLMLILCVSISLGSAKAHVG